MSHRIISFFSLDSKNIQLYIIRLSNVFIFELLIISKLLKNRNIKINNRKRIKSTKLYIINSDKKNIFKITI